MLRISDQELKQEARSRGYRPEMIEKVYHLLVLLDKVNFSVKDIRDKLLPVLKESEAPGTQFPDIEKWAKKIVDECKSSLNIVLPFRKNEIEFLEQLQKHSKICPELISDDSDFCERVSKHPLLHWRAEPSN